MTPSCSGTTPASATCTGNPPGRSRFSSDSRPAVAITRHQAGRHEGSGGATFLAPKNATVRRMVPSSSLVIAALLYVSGPIVQASAQQRDVPATKPPSALDPTAAAEQYEPVFEALHQLMPRADSVALVRNVSLRRDAIQFLLENGRLYLATPVRGRKGAGIFAGQGAGALTPPPRIYRRGGRPIPAGSPGR